MSLPRPCYRCGRRINNPSKAQKICDDCVEKATALGQNRRTKNYRIYNKRCHKCDKRYRTIHKYSKLCSHCDTSKNKFKRAFDKKIIK